MCLLHHDCTEILAIQYFHRYSVYAITGDLHFNPETDFLTAPNGEKFKLESPYGDELPGRGWEAGVNYYTHPPADGSDNTG